MPKFGVRRRRGGYGYRLTRARSPLVVVAWFACALLAGGVSGLATVALTRDGRTAIAAKATAVSPKEIATVEHFAAVPAVIEPVATMPAPVLSKPSALPMSAPVEPVSQIFWQNCSQARAAGAAPIYVGEPGYRPGPDRDDDGIACEPYRGRR